MTTQAIKFSGWTRRIVAVFLVLAAGLLLAGPVGAVVKPGAKYAGGNMTLEAKNATVGELLETIARTAGVDIFVAPGFQTAGQKMTIQISDEPLEEAIRRILRGHNYAAIYEKEGNDFRIAALKIYPDGQASGAVVPLFSGGRTPIYEEKNRRGETVTVLVTTGGELTVQGGVAKRGPLVPSQLSATGADAVIPGLNTPWMAMQADIQTRESEDFQRLLYLQKQWESAKGADEKKTAYMRYTDQVAKFESQKRANINKVEALKRVGDLQGISYR